ncbi:anaerobic ribonucleoside-triphosphate reductase [Peptostreptococcus sp.]|uniref:anaerobic ribonucleoside-triphosphate reductase n=1 Tax=Peptostreptococcus sp. TaxID=1262 RepID=UPI001D7C9780|nr:anaerobic ribonucleoside-triphosphate reductase [Peptostreptococcus sp.]MBS5596878.1 anaerobic ribonucleoside-triphosphate reductase [Peptostreptococcus sp.]
MLVIKRNGKEVEFDHNKIKQAIVKANVTLLQANRLSEAYIDGLVDIAIDKCNKLASTGRALTVEDIQDVVEEVLMQFSTAELSRAYVRYRYDREKIRATNNIDDEVLTLIECENEDVLQENSNKNPTIISTQRDYMAGAISKDLSRRKFLSKDIIDAHDEGIIHFHDMDYFAQHAHNCCLVNLEDMLQNGTVISGTMIEKPHCFSTACNIATQIIAQVASSQYGGQSISLAHLAPFVQVTREKYMTTFEDEFDTMKSKEWYDFIEKLVKEDIKRGVQTIQYQVVTLMTTNGQAPFVTVYMDINEVPPGRLRDDLASIIEEVLRQRIQGVKNEVGQWIAPAFPKLIYCLDENNTYPNSEYYYLTELAAECTAKRMVPDYISAKVMRELKGDVYTCMGCRSFLTPDRTPKNLANAKNYKYGKKYYGRFNQGVVTINLVDVALSSNRDTVKFWDILGDRLELCFKALMARHKRLLGTPSDVAPILWQYGALARLKKGEVIDKLLYDGYSTISLGYAGLYECTKYMTGKSHTDDIKGKPFAIALMKTLNLVTEQWRKATNIDFSLYGTPLESTTYKFAKCLQRRHGIIEGITDRNYITNSYHVNVREEINAFNKLRLESEFQPLSPGGAISYVEVPNMTNNLEAVLEVIRYIYETIMYAEINTKFDYCHECGFEGEIKIIKDDHSKLIWQCPKCGNTNQDKMTVVRRTCGYIGSNFWNQGRTQEIDERVLHL